jgi:hypothetical protein
MNEKQLVERLKSRKYGIATRFAFGWTALIAFLLLAGGAFATPVFAASSSQSGLHHLIPRTLTSPNAGPAGGFSIAEGSAVIGNTVLVGAWNETADGYVGAGHAYIYSAKTGALLHTLTSPNAQTNGEFGWSLALNGNTVDVGAFLETANGYAGAGHAYVFHAETGALIATLTSPNSQTNGGFGESVGASGKVMVVGAYAETANGYAGAGHAYIYYA